jgi:cell wall assembly regulator SMI1
MPFILDNTGQASLSDIAAFERRIGLQLPEDYRRYLAAKNGGNCYSDGTFREAGTGEEISSVNIVLGLRDDPDYDIEQALSGMSERMPAQLLPICYDDGGNYLLLDCSDARRGMVYFLSLEAADEDDEGESPALESLTVVARSFSELLEQLNSNS